MDIKLLRQIKARILKEPRQFFMEWYFAGYFTEDPLDVAPTNKRIPNCGTAACIAGWAVTLRAGTTPKKAWARSDNVYRTAQEELGLTEDQAERLFAQCLWPLGFRVAYGNSKSAKARAQIAARRIDHFIKTKGEE